MSFAQKLLSWYAENGRDLPWRNTKDPYIIWLSEIILQQTRVEQGMPYFYRFVEAFPTVEAFSRAEEEEVLRLWQGLGYYSRARNMHKAAKMVMELYGGEFPAAYDKVIKLSGVGEYTASAIASFSAGEKRAVLDGNVFRVLSRYLAIDVPINTTHGKKVFSEVAEEMVSAEQPGLYNQAIMDFGATVCKPKGPLCSSCIFRYECAALQQGVVSELPKKIKGKASRNRYFNYFIIENENGILMSQRPEGDVWANLFEFPLIETEQLLTQEELVETDAFKQHFGSSEVYQIGKTVKHVLSHQNIFANFYRIIKPVDLEQKKANWCYYNSENLDKLAKHKLIFSFINKYIMY